MKRLLISLIPTIVILSIFVVACDKKGEGGGDEFYPTPDGAKWLYNISGMGGYSSDSQNSNFGLLNIISDYATTQQDQIYLRINGTAQHQTAGTVDVLEASPDDSEYVIFYYIYVDENEGRWYYYLDDDTHWLLLKFPLTSGKTWNFDLYGATYTATIIGEESVTVPAGTFENCIKIEYSEEGIVVDRIWFSADVGMVRVNEITEDMSYMDMQLLSYNIPTY
jgi:hypothetical protein